MGSEKTYRRWQGTLVRLIFTHERLNRGTINACITDLYRNPYIKKERLFHHDAFISRSIFCRIKGWQNTPHSSALRVCESLCRGLKPSQWTLSLWRSWLGCSRQNNTFTCWKLAAEMLALEEHLTVGVNEDWKVTRDFTCGMQTNVRMHICLGLCVFASSEEERKKAQIEQGGKKKNNCKQHLWLRSVPGVALKFCNVPECVLLSVCFTTQAVLYLSIVHPALVSNHLKPPHRHSKPQLQTAGCIDGYSNGYQSVKERHLFYFLFCINWEISEKFLGTVS